MAHCGSCQCSSTSSISNNNSSNNSSILYSLLNSDAPRASHAPRSPRLTAPSTHACACGAVKRVSVRAPHSACRAACAVLVKTLKFVKSVPCFRALPAEDQRALVRRGWAPLLVLGMAQDGMDFETAETAEVSLLQRILTGGEQQDSARTRTHAHTGVALADVQTIKTFLSKCWALDISTKEYAYLKGAILFNPDVAGLQCHRYIQGLQSEAHQALNEYVKMIHGGDTARFAKLFIALSMLRSINANVVAGLFFKPVIGSVNMEELLLDMFYGK
ncbi:nuclear receptor subfamily 0 group B member 1-like [Hoplias malabaricus]|uniref:nuclear receptor subfamily 0 group B member 1-like n=1 Tax=Hoplias malabaricus TaxID=27720 RepID=UPI0034630233